MMKISSLGDFGNPLFDNRTTASLINDSLIYCTRDQLNEETQPFAVYLRDFPVVFVTYDMLATRESARTLGADLFLPVQDSVFKKIASIWREKGIVDAIRIAANEEPQRITPVIHWIATRLTRVLDLIEKGTYRIERLPISGSGSVADVASTRDWATALIRCISWHPHWTRLAIATRDDRIRVFSKDISGVAILKHNAQKSVCCINWRPNSGRELAVACQSGILIWTVELGAASNSLSHALLLKYKNHAPVTSVTWNPEGDLLVSSSLSDSNMIIWDVSKETGVPLKRVGGGGLCFTRWSSNGSRLLSSTCGKVFRVWNIGTGSPWVSEKWTVPNGRVAAACFGPKLTLLFASTEDPAMVFYLPLEEHIFDVKKSSSLDDIKVAIPLIDLSKCTFTNPDDEEEEVTVGGRVISMDWDPSGRYLALIFQESPLVAVFKTKVGATSRVTDLKPGCLIKGFSAEVPSCIQFYQNYVKDSEIVRLTIAWSSGRVQHFPIISAIENRTDLCKLSHLSNSLAGSPSISHYSSF
ncbi:aladin-like [Belonocnema kinseyi]|uniref:aladin-like n=1 Tax=Belonocnema kinseyi TaxID=2817044 RepID=UPI00143CC76C|nr:aladin-like [Belonocnema kinseyi]XP_033220696.1 aladin-like [Belonocnema kinseyi]